MNIPEPLFHCFKCRKVFSCRLAMRKHVKAYAGQTGCKPCCREDHIHQSIQEEFDTMEEAYKWYYSNELDRYISGYTTIPSLKSFKCSQRTNSQKGAKKTKKLFNCPAKMSFRRAEVCMCSDVSQDRCTIQQFRILVYGCVAHSHPMEQKYFRLSKVTKDRIRTYLKSGMSIKDILTQHFASPEDDPNSKPVLSSDIYRIAKASNLLNKANILPLENTTAESSSNNLNEELAMETGSFGNPEEQNTSQTIEVQTITDQEMANFRMEFSLLREKTLQIDFILASPDFKIDEKRAVMHSLRTLPIQEVEIPPIKSAKISRDAPDEESLSCVEDLLDVWMSLKDSHLQPDESLNKLDAVYPELKKFLRVPNTESSRDKAVVAITHHDTSKRSPSDTDDADNIEEIANEEAKVLSPDTNLEGFKPSPQNVPLEQICHRRKKSDASSNHTMQIQDQNEETKNFDCEQCDEQFFNKKTKSLHIRTKHVKKYECQLCGLRVGSPYQLERHHWTHNGEKPYECDQCEYRSARKGNLDKHKGEKHGDFGDRSCFCEICGVPFQTPGSLKYHIQMKHVRRENRPVKDEKPFQCDRCEYKFSSQFHLNQHVYAKHEFDGVKRFCCELCGKSYKSGNTLKGHLRFVHWGEQRRKSSQRSSNKTLNAVKEHVTEHHATCATCETQFSHKPQEWISDHIKSCKGRRQKKKPKYKKVGTKQFICSFEGCSYNQVFKTTKAARFHFFNEHTTEEDKIYPCSFCETKFAFITARTRHINLKHIKKYKCDLCGRAFGEPNQLAKHQKTHSGEKPFSCEQCGNRFSRKSNLDQHKQTVHGDFGKRDCYCEVCGMPFASVSSLKVHILMKHTRQENAPPKEDKPYHCDKCDYRASCPAHLRSHVESRHDFDGIKKFFCEICGNAFKGMNTLRGHLRFVHGGAKRKKYAKNDDN
ncbi:hypothetical protein TCAL_04239, partial [Tigriopus californicus]